MIMNFLLNYYSNKNCSIDKIFVDNCKENNCKITNLSNVDIILNGDEIEKCLTKYSDKSANRIIISSKDNELTIVVCELSKGKRNL